MAHLLFLVKGREMNVINLEGKVALVTGAGSGLGKAAALALAGAGAKVGVLSRTKKEADAVTRQINRKNKGSAVTLLADISKPLEVKMAVADLVKAFGRLDIVFANAGINGVWTSLEEMSPADWDETIGINLTGTFLTVKYAVPHLKERGGSIIVTSSVNGTRMFSNTGASAYATSKAGQVAFAKMIAVELGPHKIRVNVICPGAIESEISDNTEQKNEDIKIPVKFPKGEIPLTGGVPGKAEQVGDLVLFLASDMSSHISGTEIWIDGAQSLLQG
jgi:NAD(P)-dependent dehydrogenase (short-subunit alcohol dehydrogenase family)